MHYDQKRAKRGLSSYLAKLWGVDKLDKKSPIPLFIPLEKGQTMVGGDNRLFITLVSKVL